MPKSILHKSANTLHNEVTWELNNLSLMYFSTMQITRLCDEYVKKTSNKVPDLQLCISFHWVFFFMHRTLNHKLYGHKSMCNPGTWRVLYKGPVWVSRHNHLAINIWMAVWHMEGVFVLCLTILYTHKHKHTLTHTHTLPQK